MRELKNKVVLITGSTRGIGRVAAHEFGKQGAHVIVTGRTLEQGAAKLPGSIPGTVREIEELGGQATGVQCNLADGEDIDHLVETVVAKFGHVDVLINNAVLSGKLVLQRTDEVSLKNWLLQFTVNVHAPFRLCKAFTPGMREAGGGVIINMTSGIGDFDPEAGTAGVSKLPGVGYGSTKAALNKFSQILARDLRRDKIAVIMVDPGITATEAMVAFADYPDAHPSEVPAQLMLQLAVCDNPFDYTGKIMRATEFKETMRLPR